MSKAPQAPIRTSEQLHLTQDTIANLKPLVVDGKVRQKLYFDIRRGEKGFGVCVGANTKAFFAQGLVDGRSVRVKLGTFPQMTLHEAREAATATRKEMNKGVNPNTLKRERTAAGITLEEAWQIHKGTLEAKLRAKTTAKRYQDVLERHFADWLTRNLASITRTEVRAKHQAIAKTVAKGTRAKTAKPAFNEWGVTSANNAMRVFRAIYNRAIRQHPELPANPCINVDWFTLRKRRSAFDAAQLRAWFDGMTKAPNHLRRDLNLFLMFSGMRPAAAYEVRWADVDFDKRSLHVPKPKGGETRAFDLPLSTALVELLESRREANKVLFPRSPFVFPSLTSASGHITEARDQAQSANEDHQTYDLRRTFITVAESLDISAYALKLLVNHQLPQGDVTAGYMRVDVDRLRAPMQAITDKLLAIVKEPEPTNGNVVDMRTRRKVAGNVATN